MNAGELKRILKHVPNDFDVPVLFGHSECQIVSTLVDTTNNQFILTVHEERDLSDHEKHEDVQVTEGFAP